MKLILTRDDEVATGIFGFLTSEDGAFSCVTLEHAYPDVNSSGYAPKIPSGDYKCFRGQHQLEGMAEPFETFEIMSVPGHSNLLFHAGNFNKDSAGCVLLGEERQGDIEVLQSRVAFERFMTYLNGIDYFDLTVE